MQGGDRGSWLFLAMARQRRGQPGEARRWLAGAEDSLQKQKFEPWQAKGSWRMLHQEAQALVLTMPRVPD